MPKISSPFRYPGGKSQLYPYIKHLLEINNVHGTYIEPFAGGAGVAIELLLQGDVERIIINDYDKSIYSAWYAILNHTKKLIQKIKETPVSFEEWENQRNIFLENKNNQNSFEGGFATLYLNRTNVSGIITGGPIGGKNQTGKYKIDARFNKNELIRKISLIHEKKNQIILTRKDANQLIPYIKDNFSTDNTFIFFDPPYYAQGKNLYKSFIDSKEHYKLFKNIESMNDFKWIVTYDIAYEIQSIYKPVKQKFTYTLNYTANNRRKASEFLFASPNLTIDSYAKVELSAVS
ncbi:DNA adenine methylase [Lactococcus petauri]|uniref:DNA adenine methylase n=1 Tax=Lactococcus petauri TaxID=1940789 RepID=UPI00254D7A0D|nr:DNA adenine methylase [Lactococcus petauri]